mmetsp:Transcript_51109/g.143240  ORF Transcript_51109/g.143240 Transcript_51109/m.143240 type:complete len:307 (-) Transcript_51109:408-1328(-)|eukprot:CAMPEP_0119484576 /NCGR_PEP_ID=MMETSP1344-20130328/11539_1 /TAXON_ID=236787 /ORGANISM="Florenciella parvula, Strain CCMP2471" /LENGTH=306 /DNA_ID=CAMNT_0007519171 /DNA_START=252 /DNA_END=1172 /DNA_ORIENTATION=-
MTLLKLALLALASGATALKLPTVPQRIRVRTARVRAPVVQALPDFADAFTVDELTKKTTRNVVGLQATAWGALSLFPGKAASMMGMAALNPLETLVMQGSALALLGLGMHIRVGSDGDASQTGFLFFASWSYLMRNAGGVMSGTMFQVSTLVNTIMAVAMARRQGGLWKTVTSLDTDGITSILPRNDAINVRNVVGIQCLFWGLIGMFQSSFLFNTIMGATGARGAAAVCSGILSTGLAVNNILLAGRVFGASSDSDAANTGALFFGGWTVLIFLAKNAGTVSGQFVVPIMAWNALMTAYCVKEGM